MYNQNFDPLNAKYAGNEEVVIKAIKREIENILNSYVGWFDPFCELIQNALDAVDERKKLNENNYIPTINIFINIKDNFIAVTDNGIGFDEQKYIKFMAPNFSFKSGDTRGHKGVGTTYLSYGFNYFQISTKTPDFSARSVMKDSRRWLYDENPAGNPIVKPDIEKTVDPYFENIDRGTSMCVKYDSMTTPKNLSWIMISDAESWDKILRVKTGLGAIKENSNTVVIIRVIDKSGKETTFQRTGIKYLGIDEVIEKTAKYTDIKLKFDELYRTKGMDFKLPAKYSNLNAIYDIWDFTRVADEIDLDEDERAFLDYYKPIVFFCYVYSLKIWEQLNNYVGIRLNNNVMYGGIQMAANNMPQGELIQIPLKKNTGRQFQAHIVIHFENCSADLGRKGFQKDITEFSKVIAKKIIDGPLEKMKRCFKKNTGVSPDLLREKKLDEWKKEMVNHEEESPLILISEHFFLPLRKISILSTPTREQDVIALFNQLIAGGVIRGINIMSTNERFTYDGLYRVTLKEPREHHIYDKNTNPLGIYKSSVDEIFKEFKDGFISEPKVLEYKYSLDGLVEDIGNGIKNSNDINLVVVWDAGELYKENYYISSLLIEDNITLRQYHGITHQLHDIDHRELVADLIILKDLVLFLNDQEKCFVVQEKYEI